MAAYTLASCIIKVVTTGATLKKIDPQIIVQVLINVRKNWDYGGKLFKADDWRHILI